MRYLRSPLAGLFVVWLLSATACNKGNDGPAPDEPELITTVQVRATEVGNAGNSKLFTYRVKSGFHAGSTDFHVDTIKLLAGRQYNIEMLVLNEQKTPIIDVTPEIIEERNAHLFYYISAPETGAGSITITDRDTDHNGQPFARLCKWHTGPAGKGTMEIFLIHGPRRKEASDLATIAGSTDAETVFPVVLY